MTKTNSFPTSAEQLIRMQQNSAEILAKLDQALSSDQSHVQVETVDIRDGTVSTTAIQTIGNLHARLQRIEENYSILAGLNGNAATVHTANNSFKRIVLADVNLEPNDISQLDAIGTFRSDKNWFFDAMMNPSMSVEFDLTGKVQQGVRKVLSRRFMVDFARDGNGVLTADGALRLKEFNIKYKGQNNIDIFEFNTWYQKSPGIRNRGIVDEQQFDLEPHRLKYNGTFSVLGTEVDTLNRKSWYKLNTLNYQDVSNVNSAPVVKTLAVGDEVGVVPNHADQSSTTVYRVVEVSTVTSDFRVRFELVTGQDPIPSRINALKMYSPVVYDKKVRITIGFDEYDVIFVKPLNANTHLLSKEWSKGTGFYTNELRLNSTAGASLKDYYIREVYDYGKVLQDLVARKVPVDQGVRPVPPNLVASNFKVVQVNKHLTDTVDAEKIRELNQQYNTYKSQVSALQTELQNKQKQNASSSYTSDAERNAATAEVSQLTEQYRSKNELSASILNKMVQQKKNINNVAPKFRVRGFWAIPDAIEASGTVPQEVVQFEVQYRYSSISGSQPQMEQFKVDAPLDASQFIAANRVSADEVAPQSKASKTSKVNATFSNWTTYLTDKRAQAKDPVTGEWKWSVEDVASADTPNINQLDISLSPGERVEVRIRSLSEVGWPEAPLTSEWSEVTTVDFPEDLNSVLSEDDFILREATQEDQRIRFVKELEANGLSKHLSTGFRSGDRDFAHKAEHIASGAVDANGKAIDLAAYLNDLRSQIDLLREQINRSKGELRLRLFRGSQEQIIPNNGVVEVFIDLEDFAQEARVGSASSYVTSTNRRNYLNTVYNMDDYYLLLDNAAQENPLGLLSHRVYGNGAGGSQTPFAYDPTLGQAVWVDNNDMIINRYGGFVLTQNNYQWLYLQNTRPDGTPIYNWGATGVDAGATNQLIHAAVTSTAFNFGVAPQQDSELDQPGVMRISAPASWESVDTNAATVAATVHPRVASLADVTEAGTEKTKLLAPGAANQVKLPLNIYWKFNTQKTADNLFGTVNAQQWPAITLSKDASNMLVVNTTLTGAAAKFAVNDELMVAGVPALSTTVLRVTAVDVGTGKITTDFPIATAPAGGTLLYVGKRYVQPNSNGAEVYTAYTDFSDTPASRSMFRLTTSGGAPLTIKRSLRFHLEPVSLTRAFQFTINFTLRQFRPIATTN